MTDSYSQDILITNFIDWKIQINWCNKNKLKDQYKIYLMCTVTWVEQWMYSILVDWWASYYLLGKFWTRVMV
jgi:hypothetical protein